MCTAVAAADTTAHLQEDPLTAPRLTDVDLTDVVALLVDMDGTLVDSDAAVERLWRRWALEHHVDPDAVVAVCHGATGEETMRRFRPDLSPAELVAENQVHLRRETADTDGVVAAVGAAELIDALARIGLPWAVVTNADRGLAQARLAAAGVEVPELVTVDEVELGKPDPASYRLGAARLGVDVERCLVVEDSGTGIAAGRAAGARIASLRRDDGDLPVADLTELAALLLTARPSH